MNAIYIHFVKLSTFVSGVPIVCSCAHTHIFNSTGPNCFKLHAVDIGHKMSKIYDGDEKNLRVSLQDVCCRGTARVVYGIFSQFAGNLMVLAHVKPKQPSNLWKIGRTIEMMISSGSDTAHTHGPLCNLYEILHLD